MAIRQKTVVTMKLTGEAPSHARVDVGIDDLTLVIDEPVVRGGTHMGPSPTQTAFASLIGCTNTIGNKCAEKLGIEIGHLSFDMEVDFDRRGVLLMEEVDVPFIAIRLTVTDDGPATQAELDRVAAETAKFCAVSKLFQQAGTDLMVTWRKV